jgi:thiol-disulfide isomerase/thioredoxin
VERSFHTQGEETMTTRLMQMPLRSYEDPDGSAQRLLDGHRYRFDHLTLPLVMRDMRFERTDPAPGDHVPSFDLSTIDGGHLRSDNLGERPVLLIFGSSTCPVTDNAAPGLNDLHRRFGDRVRFVMVNVREAHPGKAFPQPATMEAKTAHATQLRGIYGFGFEIAVDDIDGTLHRAMSPKPNSAYLLAPNGTILFRAQWANDTQALERAIEATTRSQAPQPSESGGILKPTLRMLRNIAPVLDRAGAGAWRDMWLVAPPLAFMAYALNTLHIRPSPNVASGSPHVAGAARGARS